MKDIDKGARAIVGACHFQFKDRSKYRSPSPVFLKAHRDCSARDGSAVSVGTAHAGGDQIPELTLAGRAKELTWPMRDMVKTRCNKEMMCIYIYMCMHIHIYTYGSTLYVERDCIGSSLKADCCRRGGLAHVMRVTVIISCKPRRGHRSHTRAHVGDMPYSHVEPCVRP